MVPYTLHSCVIVVILVSGPVADVAAKTSESWGVFFLVTTEVPFSDDVIYVAEFFEVLW